MMALAIWLLRFAALAFCAGIWGTVWFYLGGQSPWLAYGPMLAFGLTGPLGWALLMRAEE